MKESLQRFYYMKTYAWANSPLIEGFVNETLNFSSRKTAENHLEKIFSAHIISKGQTLDQIYKSLSIELFLKNYQISELLKNQGYVGNYAMRLLCSRTLKDPLSG